MEAVRASTTPDVLELVLTGACSAWAAGSRRPPADPAAFRRDLLALCRDRRAEWEAAGGPGWPAGVARALGNVLVVLQQMA